MVANDFYTKPLVRALQSADRYQILCLSRSKAQLFEGNRDALDPIDLSDMPSTVTEVLGDERTASHVSVRSGPGGASFYHGAGGAKDEVDLDRERFFRAIDRAILENHSRPSGLPLLLAALTENHAPFRAVSHNPFLLAEGIQINPEALNLEQLRRWPGARLNPPILSVWPDCSSTTTLPDRDRWPPMTSIRSLRPRSPGASAPCWWRPTVRFPVSSTRRRDGSSVASLPILKLATFSMTWRKPSRG